MGPFSEALEDTVAARAVLDRLGKLTEPVFASIARWYPDVVIDVPVATFDFDAETRFNLTAQVLDEMAEAFEKHLTVGEEGGFGFEELAARVDPLWRELASIYGHLINAQWESIRPADAEELAERINALEQLTGLDRKELRHQALTSPKMRSVLASIGLHIDDLG